MASACKLTLVSASYSSILFSVMSQWIINMYTYVMIIAIIIIQIRLWGMWTWYFLDSTGQITADRNISITSIIWIATVLKRRKKFVYGAYVDYKLHNNCADDWLGYLWAPSQPQFCVCLLAPLISALLWTLMKGGGRRYSRVWSSANRITVRNNPFNKFSMITAAD